MLAMPPKLHQITDFHGSPLDENLSVLRARSHAPTKL
jgi:hypothetical protein